MRLSLALVVLLLVPAPVEAQERPLFDLSPHAREVAGRASDAMVATQIGIETFHSLRSDEKWRALGCQGARLGLALGAAEGLKRAVKRTRPDGSDRASFPSQHAAVAFSQGGWRASYTFFIGGGTGVGRMAAKKHYPTDVLAGSLLGLSMQFLPGCRGR